ncbi:MAG: hypothetical protein ACP5HM_01855 [Anaerolineae bacterium]
MAKKRKLPKHLRLSMLRPKLGTLLEAESVMRMEDASLKRELDALFQGLAPEEFLPILIKTACDAKPEVQTRLDDAIPEWLEEHEYVDPLIEIAKQRTLDATEKRCIEGWLEETDVAEQALEQIEQKPNLFYKAYTHTDRFGSQGFILVMWYTNQHRHRATGFQFLIDHNPPWEGALKDSMLLPRRRPQKLKDLVVGKWQARGVDPLEVGPADVKQEILTALQHNREEGIRLPRDLIPYRALFIEQILSLPDTPETPKFTPEDFDELSRKGKTPESISLFERTVGRRARLDDGTEVFYLGNPFEDEPW